MKLRLVEWDGSGPAALAADLRASTPDPAAIADDVTDIVAQVRAGGDRAAAELGERFDGVRVADLRLDGAERRRLADAAPGELRAALSTAAVNIRAVAEMQVAAGREPIEQPLTQGQRVTIVDVPVGSAAIYVPGGRAPYPSTVLMGGIAARAAGVERVALATPPSADGLVPPAIAAAAEIAEIDDVYPLGGAQAIAALAYGTETIAPVDLIAGPGGPWVQEAKLAVSRTTGIDGYAGPSELVIVSDGTAEARWLALDLCAQAEHGDDGLLVFAGAGEDLAALGAELERISQDSPTVADATVVMVGCPNIDAAMALSESLAPEHLQLACSDAERLAGAVRTAGCVLTGPHGGTAFGDYAAGSNHVLPTGGAGRFTGPLGPRTFRRSLSIVGMTPESAVELGSVVETIARSEGFDVHAASAVARGRSTDESERI